jgi:hypothetical protein
MRSVTDLRLAVAFAAAAAAGGAVAHAEPPGQAGTAQPLNMTIPVVNGTGAISGVVTDATTRKPVPGVAVHPGPPTRGPVGQPILQLSDAQGRFVFRDLPPSEAGEYRPAVLLAAAPGWWLRSVLGNPGRVAFGPRVRRATADLLSAICREAIACWPRSSTSSPPT